METHMVTELSSVWSLVDDFYRKIAQIKCFIRNPHFISARDLTGMEPQYFHCLSLH